MSYRTKAIAAAALSLASLALAPSTSANAADFPVKAKPIADVPFFLVVDDRFTYSYQFTATDPGAFSVRPNGSINGDTAKQVYSFTHFDVWAYGTNFINLDLLKSDHNDPASPCTNVGVDVLGVAYDRFLGTAAAGGIAFVNAIGNLGGFCGPYLVGWLKDHTGGYSAGMAVLGLGLVMTASVVSTFSRPRTAVVV